MATDITHGLHLTIDDKDGTVSLWDSAEAATRGREPHERYVLLPLTAPQRTQVAPRDAKLRILARLDVFLDDDTSVTELKRDVSALLEELQ